MSSSRSSIFTGQEATVGSLSDGCISLPPATGSAISASGVPVEGVTVGGGRE